MKNGDVNVAPSKLVPKVIKGSYLNSEMSCLRNHIYLEKALIGHTLKVLDKQGSAV